MPPAPHHKEAARRGFSERLRNSLELGGRSTRPGALAAEFNVYYGGPPLHVHSCRKWLQGDAIPTQEKLVVLAHMLGVTAEWLRYGDETRLLQADAPSAFTRPELALLADWRRLTDRDRQVVRRLVSLLLRTP